MAGNPFFQNLDPYAVPDPVTPFDAPGHAEGYAGVTPPGTGPAPAPYDISAPQDIAGITAATNAAGALSGAGIVYPAGPRQQQTADILYSPQGAASSNVFAGFPDYENQDLRPNTDLMTPVQGTMTYPVDNTYQPGIPQFMDGLGASAGETLPGVPPESGSMGPTAGMDYPGTVQSGLEMYGTS